MYNYEDGKHEPYVYFMQFGHGNPVKIGFTRNLGARLRSIESNHIEPLTLLVVAPGGKELEDRIHRRLAKFKIRGEWFSDSEHVRGYARELESADLIDKLRASIELAKNADLDDLYAHTSCPTCGEPYRTGKKHAHT